MADFLGGQIEFVGNKEDTKGADATLGPSLQRALDLDGEEMAKDPVRWAKFKEVIDFFAAEEDPEFFINKLYRRKLNDMDRLNYMFEFVRLSKVRAELLTKKQLKRSERRRLAEVESELELYLQ